MLVDPALNFDSRSWFHRVLMDISFWNPALSRQLHQGGTKPVEILVTGFDTTPIFDLLSPQVLFMEEYIWDACFRGERSCERKCLILRTSAICAQDRGFQPRV